MSSEQLTIRFSRPVRAVSMEPPRESARDGRSAEQESEADGLMKDYLRRKEGSLKRKEAELLRLEEELNEQKAAFAERIRRMSELMESLARARADMLEAHEEDIVSLSLSISEKVLEQEIESGTYKVREVLRSALKAMRGRGEIVVKVNPQDYELAEAAAAEVEAGSGFSSIEVVPDKTVPLASCSVESESGRLFSSVAQKLAKIEADLLKKNGALDGF